MQSALRFTVASATRARRLATTMSSSLKYPKPLAFPPPSGIHKSTCIFLHGLGDSGEGWADVAPMLGSALPDTRWVFPTAPERPITVNGGMRMNGWYDIASLDRIGDQQDVQGLLESARFLEGLIAAEVAAGVPSSSVLVGGFSQGAATALLALRGCAELAGVAALSGYLPLHTHPPGVASEANAATPVFMSHGDSDQVVAFKYGSESAAWLKEAGVAVDFRVYRGMGHEARGDELEDLKAFLVQCLRRKA